MSDRQLLELAAKAAGIEEWLLNTQNGNVWDQEKLLWRRAWNPIDDDGDALRLAVKLGIGNQSYSALGYSSAGTETIKKSIVLKHSHNGDPYAATRRAIVMAAADIGRNKT